MLKIDETIFCVRVCVDSSLVIIVIILDVNGS